MGERYGHAAHCEYWCKENMVESKRMVYRRTEEIHVWQKSFFPLHNFSNFSRFFIKFRFSALFSQFLGHIPQVFRTRVALLVDTVPHSRSEEHTSELQ